MVGKLPFLDIVRTEEARAGLPIREAHLRKQLGDGWLSGSGGTPGLVSE